jgi:hypothetical protein
LIRERRTVINLKAEIRSLYLFQEILVEKSELQLTESIYHSEDKLLLGEDYEESESLLEEESEDYKDSKLMMWFECEDEIPVWRDTEETLLTWHESEVGPLPICPDNPGNVFCIRTINMIVDGGFLGCDAMWTCKWIQFWRNIGKHIQNHTASQHRKQPSAASSLL